MYIASSCPTCDHSAFTPLLLRFSSNFRSECINRLYTRSGELQTFTVSFLSSSSSNLVGSRVRVSGREEATPRISERVQRATANFSGQKRKKKTLYIRKSVVIEKRERKPAVGDRSAGSIGDASAVSG